MRTKIYISILFMAVFSTSSFAAEPLTVRDRIATFLETKVMGKTQEVSAKGKITADGQDFLVDFKATVTWTGLKKTSEGLVFEETRDIKQTNTKMDANGEPLGEAIKNDRIVKLQFAVGEREVTKTLVGLAIVMENSLEEPTGVGFTTMMEISDNDQELFVYQSMTGFVETSFDGKNVTPTSSASSATLALNSDGKLQTDETLKFYKVDINNDFARKEINRFNLTAVEVSR